jgi:membrane glycosyltransferase
MLKTGFSFFFLLSLSIALSANAQTTDTAKRDTVKIDTNLLNRYRIAPRPNSIPVPIKPLLIQQELIPVTMLDYKVSYWRRYITLGLNFNQAAFSNNYSAGALRQ